jgi:integrase
MARIRRGAEFGTREARRRLRARPEPYWMPIDRGLSLGYRKSDEGGSWVIRRYVPRKPPKSGRWHEEKRLGTADDSRDADGADVLDFGQAQRKLLAQARQDALQASGQLYTVADAVKDYIDWQRSHRKSADDSQYKLKAYVLPELGTRRVADLKLEDFTAWQAGALKRQRRRKAARPKKRRVAPTADGGQAKDAAAAAVPKPPTPDELAERQRRHKVTVNRVIGAFKACLNHAYSAAKVPSREAWTNLKKYRAVDSARLRWLSLEEAHRLQNAAGPGLRPLIAAALNTGCRAGELLAMRAGDFDPSSKTVLVANSKAGKPRRVPLGEQGVAIFEQLTAGKLAHEAIFARADATPWYHMALVRAMAEASKAAKVSPPATFHTLRHTFASHLVQQGVPLMFVASALGHRDTRMVERHYGHLSQSAVADMIRAKLPSFGAPPATKVSTLRAGEGS